VRLSCGRLGHDDECDLAGFEQFGAGGARKDAATRRKDARHADKIARSDAGRTERELEGRELLAVLARALRQEHLLGNESDHVALLVERGRN
jgi:hypothetical protein